MFTPWFGHLLEVLTQFNFADGSDGKQSARSARDLHSIPGLGRSLGEGNGYPLQYSCLENSVDRGACWATVHGVAKSRTWLRDFHSLTSSDLLQQKDTKENQQGKRHMDKVWRKPKINFQEPSLSWVTQDAIPPAVRSDSMCEMLSIRDTHQKFSPADHVVILCLTHTKSPNS